MNTKENIQLATLAILGAVSVSAVSIALVWFFQKIYLTKIQSTEITNEMKMFTKQNVRVHSLKRLVRNTKASQAVLSSFFIQESELASFLGKIEKIQFTTGATVQIKAVTVGEAIGKEGILSPLTITVASIGKFNQVIHTLFIIEALPKVSNIISTKIAQDSKTKKWTGTFQLQVIKIQKEKDKKKI